MLWRPLFDRYAISEAGEIYNVITGYKLTATQERRSKKTPTYHLIGPNGKAKNYNRDSLVRAVFPDRNPPPVKTTRKLVEEQVREIKRSWDGTYSHALTLAADAGVHVSSMLQLLHGKTWKTVEV